MSREFVDKKLTIQVRISRDLHALVVNKLKTHPSSITKYLNALIIEDLESETVQRT